jgi:hypothetical protein
MSLRRLIDLLVKSVDLVDNPANQQPFLVVKSAEPEAVESAVWSTAFVNNLPDSAFLYVENGGKKDSEGKTTPRSLRHLPVRDENGKIDLPHLRNALARIPQMNADETTKTRLTESARKLLSQEGGEGSKKEKAMTTMSNIESDGAAESVVSDQITTAPSNGTEDLPLEIQKALAEADEFFKADTQLAEKLHTAIKRAVDEVVVEKAMDPSKAAAAVNQAVKLCEQMAKMDGMPGPAKTVMGRIQGILAKLKGVEMAAKQAACDPAPKDKVKKDTEIEKADQPAAEPAPPVATEPAQPVEKAGAKMAQANMETLMNGIETLNQGVETLKKLAAAMMPPKKEEPPVADPGEEERKKDPGFGAAPPAVPPVKKDSEPAPAPDPVEKETAPAPAAPAAPAPAPAAPAADPLAEVTKSLGSIAERLAKIEGNVGSGSKQATSSKPEGDAAGKIEKSFWSGLGLT